MRVGLKTLGIDYHKMIYEGFVGQAKKYPEKIINIDASLSKNLISKY